MMSLDYQQKQAPRSFFYVVAKLSRVIHTNGLCPLFHMFNPKSPKNPNIEFLLKNSVFNRVNDKYLGYKQAKNGFLITFVSLMGENCF